jgi:hypothetical protein
MIVVMDGGSHCDNHSDHILPSFWEKSSQEILVLSGQSKSRQPLSLVGGSPSLGSLLFGTRSPSTTIMAITAGAVVGDVEPRAIEDDGRGRKHAAHLAVTVWALLQRWIVEMLATLKMHTTGHTFVFVHGHDNTSPSLFDD